jgi:predicted 3-demethylubiquinone-9 3-methyltransferase (glyoxalase superfamily)
MRLWIAIVCVLLFTWSCLSVAQEVPVLVAGDLPAGSILSTDYYAGRALFGYIDGGAELYLEYGFRKLGRQEVTTAGEKIVVEVYQMAGAYEAYGIFSVQRFKCIPVDSLSPNTCLSKYQLQAVVGNCYLSIINETGSASARSASVAIFKAIRAKEKAQTIDFPAVFADPELKPHRSNIIVAFGRLGVQNGCSEWDSLFQNVSRFRLTLLPMEIGSEHCSIAHLRFSSEGESKEFCRLAGFSDVLSGSVFMYESGGTVRLVRRVSAEEVLFGEATAAFPSKEPIFRLLSTAQTTTGSFERAFQPTRADQAMSNTITTFLMFEGRAEEAMNFYVSLFENSAIDHIIRYKANEAGAEGTVMQAFFTLNGRKFMCIDSPAKHGFTFTPAISLFVDCSSRSEVDNLFQRLSEGGQVMMPLDSYPFSDRFGWVADKFGVSWQLNLKK